MHQALQSWNTGDSIVTNTLSVSCSEGHSGIMMAHLLKNYTSITICHQHECTAYQSNVIVPLNSSITPTFLGEFNSAAEREGDVGVKGQELFVVSDVA